MRYSQKKLTIQTNGTFLAEFIDYIEKNYQKAIEFIHFRISLDGNKEINDKKRKTKNGEGFFDRVITNVKFALSKGFKMYIKMTIDVDTIESIPCTIRMFENKGFLDDANFNFGFSSTYDYSNGSNNTKYDFVEKYINLKQDFEFERTNRSRNAVLEYGTHNLNRLINRLSNIEGRPKCDGCSSMRTLGFIFRADGSVGFCQGCDESYTIIGRFYPEIEINFETLLSIKGVECV